ncbi:DUF1987 domain-containing protein [Desulfotomaculum sp. 1211_IL3151]|uniref:DUF1987 domain-containing protein n=1 Tax=Desulfotomaculum sp. 1211_IL3151 TaxID=3084055 RepID=UPI002FDA6541
MNILHIEGSRSTPTVIFDCDKNLLFLQGQSYPENAFKFYEPIFQWLDEYLEKLNTDVLVQIDFNLPYINTSSSKCIMMLLEKLDKAHESGKGIILNWYYHEDNESELECAEEFKEDLSLPFNIIPREDQ